MDAEKPKSERNLIAERLAEFARESNLCTPYGGDVALVKKPKPHYTFNVALPRVLDGTVCVYAPNFIVVKFQTAIRTLPQEETVRFTDEEMVKKFLKAAFVDHDDALAIRMMADAKSFWGRR